MVQKKPTPNRRINRLLNRIADDVAFDVERDLEVYAEGGHYMDDAEIGTFIQESAQTFINDINAFTDADLVYIKMSSGNCLEIIEQMVYDLGPNLISRDDIYEFYDSYEDTYEI